MMDASSFVASVEMTSTMVVVVPRLGEPGSVETSRRAEAGGCVGVLWMVVAERRGKDWGRGSGAASAVDCSLAGDLSAVVPGPAESI
jgi:hypothetical protein